jgi:hypothetical protein
MPQVDALADLVEQVIRTALQPVMARIMALEFKSSMSDAADGALVTEIKALRDAAGGLRERVAVFEAATPVPGPAGPAGRDGVDGMSVEDLAVNLEADGRTMTLAFQRNGVAVKTASVKVPWLMDRGVYREGTAYDRGDVVSWDGSAWACQEETTARPGSTGSAWRLCVKRGRDGSR